MNALKDGNTAQHRRRQEADQSWLKKDHCTHLTMHSNMHKNLIIEFEDHATAHAMWDTLKLKYGVTSATRLGGLNIKFESCKIRPNHTMKQHLKMMSTIIRELKVACNNLTEEQNIEVGIRSLPDLLETMVISMTHNKNIKTLMISHGHLELEAECLGTSKASKDTRYMGAPLQLKMIRGPKRKNYALRRDFGNGPVPKKAKNAKRKQGQQGGKGKNRKCFNCNKEGQFARDCTEPRKIFSDFNSYKFLFLLMLWLLTHIHIKLLIQE